LKDEEARVDKEGEEECFGSDKADVWSIEDTAFGDFLEVLVLSEIQRQTFPCRHGPGATKTTNTDSTTRILSVCTSGLQTRQSSSQAYAHSPEVLKICIIAAITRRHLIDGGAGSGESVEVVECGRYGYT
jgi:hypothetical protein